MIGGKRSFSAQAGDPEHIDTKIARIATSSIEDLRNDHVNMMEKFYMIFSSLDERAVVRSQHCDSIEKLYVSLLADNAITKRLYDLRQTSLYETSDAYATKVKDARSRFRRLRRQQLKDIFPRFLCIVGLKPTFLNGCFEFDDELSACGVGAYPVYGQLPERKCWLYMNEKHQWCISDTADMFSSASQGWAHSAAVSDILCPTQSEGWQLYQDNAWNPDDLKINEVAELELVVRSLAGDELLKKMFAPTVLVDEVKSALKDLKPRKTVCFTFRNRVLQDNVLLGSLGIEAGEFLYAIFQDLPKPQQGL